MNVVYIGTTETAKLNEVQRGLLSLYLRRHEGKQCDCELQENVSVNPNKPKSIFLCYVGFNPNCNKMLMVEVGKNEIDAYFMTVSYSQLGNTQKFGTKTLTSWNDHVVDLTLFLQSVVNDALILGE